MTDTTSAQKDDLLQRHQRTKLNELLARETTSWSKYEEAKRELSKDRVYQHERDHGRESRATPWWYIGALVGIGLVEWLINYDSFERFLGVPAWALGTTFVVAIFVAIASHVHGTLAKQPTRRQELRLSDDLSDGAGYLWGVVAISVILFAVFLFVVLVRYLAWSELNQIGVEASVWPKVWTTLLSNVFVWAIGGAVAWGAHSKGQYTKRQAERDKTKRRYDKAEQSVNKYRGELQANRPSEQADEVEAHIERERVNRRKTTSSLAAMTFLIAMAMLCIQPANAQLSSEYDIDQFCTDANVAAANPLRQTVVYVDETIAAPSDFASDHAKETNDWKRALADGLRTSEWYTQLESKLTASLMASEHVTVLLVRADGSVEDVAEFCWPGYGEKQREEIAARGVLESFFTADPVDELATQRSVAFALVRSALAEGLSTGALPSAGKNYIRALSRDEGRLRNERGRFVRVIFYGGMVEDSEYGSVQGDDSPRDLARRAVERTSLRLGGASFYIYGPRDISDKLQAFWSELLRRGGGQLAALGSDLALVAKVPTTLHRFSLEVDVAPPEHVRRGRATVLVAQGDEVVDGAIVLAGTFRAALSGNLSCSEGSNACSSSCDLRVETRRSVYFKSLPRETLEITGTNGSLEGYIGERDSGQPSRAYAKVSAKAEGCE